MKSLKDVGNAVKLGLKVASVFTTLRDMGGVEVQPGDLTPVRKLGEGASVVEEAQYRSEASATGGA